MDLPAKRPGQTITRNSSFFKKFQQTDVDVSSKDNTVPSSSSMNPNSPQSKFKTVVQWKICEDKPSCSIDLPPTPTPISIETEHIPESPSIDSSHNENFVADLSNLFADSTNPIEIVEETDSTEDYSSCEEEAQEHTKENCEENEDYTKEDSNHIPEEDPDSEQNRRPQRKRQKPARFEDFLTDN